MPLQKVVLRPGVNRQLTPTQNQGGYSLGNLIRFRDGLAQKIGGWVAYYAFAVGGIPRAMHAWQDFNETDYLAVGTTTLLGTISDDALTDITPQTYTSNFNPNFTTVSSSTTVTVVDANIANVTTNDSVEFKTPVSVGGIILSGVYPIDVIGGTTQYNITAATAATSSQTNATITGITQANPAVVTTSGAHGFSNGQLIYIYGVVGMTQVNGLLFTAAGVTGTTFQLTGINSTGYTAYSSGGTASPSAVPMFTTTSGSSIITVTLQAHGLSVGDKVNFPISTTVGGCVISGTYTATAISSVNAFTISVDTQATSSTSAFMNSGQAEILYYIALGPQPAATGYGIGGYGTGGYGTGSVGTAQTGTAITSSDWTLDNWGATLLACPAGGGVYQWTPDTGFQNAQLIPQAPLNNGGILIAQPAQILIAWGTSTQQAIGVDADPLTYSWSDQLDYEFWTAGVVNPSTNLISQAGNNRIPTGSAIKAGLTVAQQVLLLTDLDAWAVSYIGQPETGLIFGQNKIGGSCGTVGAHAIGQLGSQVMWMGRSNFFRLSGNGVEPMPCTVWDAVFQDLDTDNLSKVRACPNTPFNEMWWEYPSASGGTGENDSYAKYNLVENTWDNGPLDRSAWIDQSVLGMPIGATPQGIIYQHEMGENADTQPLEWSFTTGYFEIAEGEDFAFCDLIVPDFKYGTYNGTQGAVVQVEVMAVNFPGDTVRTFGPYTFTSTSTQQNVRIRARQLAFRVFGTDLNSFVRLGRVRVRLAPDGRR